MPINKRGGRGYKDTPRKRKKASFESRYGMSASEWRKLKKTDPQKAHQLRLKALIK
jgi:hypothetical protein